jgi:hypothetical protein
MDGGKPRIAVGVRAPAGSAPQLFVEGPDGWFLAAPDRMTPSDIAGASGTVLVDVDRPKGAGGAVRLLFTLAAGARAVETGADLDADRLPP